MAIRLLMAARLIREAWPTATTRELTFAPIHRSAFPPFEPGDHIQLQHADGTRRDYSLIGPCDGATYTIAVRRDDRGRGGSVLFHDNLHVGDIAFVSYPQPGMHLVPDVSHHLFIAGGIGITAVLTLIEAVPPDQTAEVHYCFRRADDAAYLATLEASGARIIRHESGAGGRLSVETLLCDAPRDTALYYCGPGPLMDAIATAVESWPVDRVNSEAFTGAVAAGERLGEPFDVWLALSKRVIHVDESESLLQAMLREEIPLEYSCEGGACGSCVLEVLEGTVEHRDLCLSDAERQSAMTACVSRGIGAIRVQA